MGNTNTHSPSPTINRALSSIPRKHRDKILTAYLELKHRHVKAHFDASWDTSGLSAGKFCEAVLRFAQFHLTGTNIPYGKHIQNFADECRKLVCLPKSAGDESVGVIIPRALVFLYTLRGKRGIGHIGGDVEANVIDASAIVSVADWIVSELIRIFHSLSLEEAQGIVDSLASRKLPFIWEVAGKKRVLHKDLHHKEKTLLLAYSEPDQGILAEDLFSWCEHSNFGAYKRDVLRKLHKDRLIEYDEDNQIVYVSPAGEARVESDILNRDIRGQHT